jgi:hypothetical protein
MGLETERLSSGAYLISIEAEGMKHVKRLVIR